MTYANTYTFTRTVRTFHVLTTITCTRRPSYELRHGTIVRCVVGTGNKQWWWSHTHACACSRIHTYTHICCAEGIDCAEPDSETLLPHRSVLTSHQLSSLDFGRFDAFADAARNRGHRVPNTVSPRINITFRYRESDTWEHKCGQPDC